MFHSTREVFAIASNDGQCVAYSTPQYTEPGSFLHFLPNGTARYSIVSEAAGVGLVCETFDIIAASNGDTGRLHLQAPQSTYPSSLLFSSCPSSAQIDGEVTDPRTQNRYSVSATFINRPFADPTPTAPRLYRK